MNKPLLLPPANEVWGKVILSQASVIPSVHREGAFMSGGHVWQEGGCVCVAGETATEAGSMHPTGMSSCYLMN